MVFNWFRELFGVFLGFGVTTLGPVVDKRGPLLAASWIFGYAILRKVTLSTPREVVVRCFHFNVPEELQLHHTDR